MMYKAGVMKGDERGFRPQDSLTRAEAARVLVEWRMWKQLGRDKEAVSGVNGWVPKGKFMPTPDGGGWTDMTPATPPNYVPWSEVNKSN